MSNTDMARCVLCNAMLPSRVAQIVGELTFGTARQIDLMAVAKTMKSILPEMNPEASDAERGWWGFVCAIERLWQMPMEYVTWGIRHWVEHQP